MNDLLDRARQCFVEYLGTSPALTDQVYNAKGSNDKAPPCIKVDAVNASEDPPFSGNFFIDIEITANTMAPTDSDGEDPKPDSDELSQNMLELLEIDNDTLMAALNLLIPNFTIMGFAGLKELEQTNSSDSWVTIWRRRIYCGGFQS